jgi:hypothetical protein
VTEETLLARIDPLLRGLGAAPEAGEEFARPTLDVRAYFRRPVKWNPVPVLGRALSLVAVVRQPLELEFSEAGYGELLVRSSLAASRRFPFWKGTVLGLAVVVLTHEPIGPDDDQILGRVLSRPLRRYRAVPFGLIRVNLGQDAVAFSLRSSPDNLFPEASRLADALSEHLRRFVPTLEV